MPSNMPSSTITDPNTIKPSPPSTLYAPSSQESLRSMSTPATSYNSSRRRASDSGFATSETVTQLPFKESLKIFGYVEKSLELISFEILQKQDPGLLKDKRFEYAEQVELNWSCRVLPPYCPNSLGEGLQDWLPDIRHAKAHRNKMTALAACRTISEAAYFATTMGYEDVGRKIMSIATEMDWCRSQMEKNNTLLPEDLPEDLKTVISQRLQGVRAAAKAGTTWEVKDQWEISSEVHEYTWARKIEENGWSNPGKWGQDRYRNYSNTSQARSHGASSGAATEDRWRRKETCEEAQEKPPAQDKSKYVPPAMRGGSKQPWTRKV